jgi:hypothetical protein
MLPGVAWVVLLHAATRVVALLDANTPPINTSPVLADASHASSSFKFEHHRVRVKESNLCGEEGSGVHSGYVDIGSKHFFFYFVCPCLV